jgi:anti-sigma28 factor (negative regulator of flagellin synthesis)
MRRVRVLTPSPDRRAVSNYVHMTVLAVRYETDGRKRRFERRDESRMTQMEQLRERIERDEYAVDPEKVAEAIVRRLMEVAAPRRG